jgi:hypothetical protein
MCVNGSAVIPNDVENDLKLCEAIYKAMLAAAPAPACGFDRASSISEDRYICTCGEEHGLDYDNATIKARDQSPASECDWPEDFADINGSYLHNCVVCGSSFTGNKRRTVCKQCAAPASGRYKDGEPCSHPGCLSHISHPCEGCGRTGGRYPAPASETLSDDVLDDAQALTVATNLRNAILHGREYHYIEVERLCCFVMHRLTPAAPASETPETVDLHSMFDEASREGEHMDDVECWHVVAIQLVSQRNALAARLKETEEKLTHEKIGYETAIAASYSADMWREKYEQAEAVLATARADERNRCASIAEDYMISLSWSGDEIRRLILQDGKP